MPAHGVARSMLLLANIDLELPNYFRYFIAAYADPSPAVCKHLHSKGPVSLARYIVQDAHAAHSELEITLEAS